MKSAQFTILLLALIGSGQAYNQTLALEFILGMQNGGGAFDSFSSPNSGAAVLALHQLGINNSNLSSGIEWLKSDLEDGSSYSWGEADIPGLNLYAYSNAGNVSELNLSDVASRLLAMRGESGGFMGYSTCIENCSNPDWTRQVWAAAEDSISTSLAAMGLEAANASNNTIRNETIGYLLSLQNENGSFNLTSSILIGNLWSLGPGIESQTAWVLLALNAMGYYGPQTLAAIDFLSSAINGAFNDSNNTFAPAIVSIAFDSYSLEGLSVASANAISCLQNPDGGFRDPSRFGEGSNVLDTAFAVIALNYSGIIYTDCTSMNYSQNQTPSPSPSPSPTSTPEPSQQVSSSSSSNYYVPLDPTPTIIPSPSPTDKITPIPSPIAILTEEERSPTQKRPTVASPTRASASPSNPILQVLNETPVPTAVTGLATGSQGQNIYYGAALLIGLAGVFAYFKILKVVK
ncbi:MAG: hypothetical protein ABH863_05235 [Candidatus Micrarchaeota archaeon]